MSVYKRGGKWWFKFQWNGETICETTKQGNKRVAEQIEAARRTELAKGLVGLKKKDRVPTLAEFANSDFLPFVRGHFADKPQTLRYYATQTEHLLRHAPLANAPLDAINQQMISDFIESRRGHYEVSTINRALETLRRMTRLAVEWGKSEKAPPRIKMLPGSKRRNRVLTRAEEEAYLKAAQEIGDGAIEAYQRALGGIRATLRGEEPLKPEDPYLLRDLMTILIDCGLRPEEAYRLQWEHVRDRAIHIPFGKTAAARRSIPLTARASAVIDMRRAFVNSEWIFPARTKSGHVEQSSVKKQHNAAIEASGVARFVPYSLRHTCLTRGAQVLDPYTLAYFAGHSDFSTTRRYVHPNLETLRTQLEKARVVQGSDNFGYTAESTPAAARPI